MYLNIANAYKYTYITNGISIVKLNMICSILNTHFSSVLWLMFT